MGSLMTERTILARLLISSYITSRANKEILYGPLHMSEARLWPNGLVIDKQHTKFLQKKTETQFQVISSKDAQIVLDYLPMVSRAIKDDLSYRNKR